MSDPEKPSIHSPEYLQELRAQSDRELDPFRDTDPATWTNEQRGQYELVLAHQIKRLFDVMEAIALELPEPKPKTARKPRVTKAKTAANPRLVPIHDI